MQFTIRLTAVFLLLGMTISLAGCAGGDDGKDTTDGIRLSLNELGLGKDLPESSDGSEFHSRLLEIAGEYTSYSLVDPNMNWAPVMCAAPSGPPEPTFSSSDEEDSHGGKLYFLLAADAGQYAVSKSQPSPIGQAIVKEAWQAEPVKNPSDETFAKHSSGRQISRYVRRGEQVYQAGKQRDLFIMFKTDPATPHTDNGWVYGVVSADGKDVLAAGRLENCMACHQDAGVDRLFGPKYPPLREPQRKPR